MWRNTAKQSLASVNLSTMLNKTLILFCMYAFFFTMYLIYVDNMAIPIPGRGMLSRWLA